jgi:hypothetical protein
MKPTSKPEYNKPHITSETKPFGVQLSELKSAYTGLQPNEWAVTRLRARILSEKNRVANDWAESVGFVFKRYVLVASIIVLAFTAILEWRSTPFIEAHATDELEFWLFGEVNRDMSDEFPELTLLMEL